MTRDRSELLTALRWHWGEAYVINCLGLGRWTAERRDTHETLRDQTPLGLRDKIIADYSARKVPRDPNGHPPIEPELGPRLPSEVQAIGARPLLFRHPLRLRHGGSMLGHSCELGQPR